MAKDKELVAVLYGANGKCKKLLVIENVDSARKNRLLNEVMEAESRQMRKEKLLNDKIDELEKNVPDDWVASYKTVNPILDKHKDAFFELFSKYFFDLWD